VTRNALCPNGVLPARKLAIIATFAVKDTITLILFMKKRVRIGIVKIALKLN
jgi:hypothetical protein